MWISIVTFSFPDTRHKHTKNQLKSFIHSWGRADYRDLMTLTATPIFDHAHPVTIEVTFSFPESVLAYKKATAFIHSVKD